MNYRINPKNGDKLSALGFGCMRFPKDEREVERQLIFAIENGVNYFDTAYIYPNSEAILGRILAKGYRDRVKIATKLPHYLVKRYEDFDKYFNAALERLQTDRIDYYFMHMLTDVKIWNRLVELGVLRWIEEKKRSGRIINLGFSYHGGKAEFVRLIDAHDWDMCLIQYNYLDEHNQAGKSGLQYAASKGLPVMVMEPLRGGKLVTALPKEIYNLWDNAYVKRSPAEWAFRWIWNHAEVTVVLSGMNSQEMIAENIAVASSAEANSFGQRDFLLFDKARAILNEKIRVPCTGCSYCMPCPKGVDIPTCLTCYNNLGIESRISAISKYIMQTSLKTDAHNASLCVKCGACETHCPQKIAIRDELAKTSRALEGFYFRPLRFVIKRFMRL